MVAEERRDDAILRAERPASPRPGAALRASAMMFEDPASRGIKAELDRLAASDVTVLITGETGTGKELVARYLHEHGRRHTGPFIAVNCGALPENLIEAELFGYEKGAYTGAQQGQPGWFEAAGGGTLLLDEIGDLPPLLQVKLLRVLQEREVVRIGGRRPVPLDVRVIAATNRDLEADVAARRFRQDLYYRLGIATVALPPLRDRPGDIEPLARFFLARLAEREGRTTRNFTPEALRLLHRHRWPGNIRELENVVHRAVLAGNGRQIGADSLRLGTIEPAVPVDEGFDARVGRLVEQAVAAGEHALFERIVNQAIRTAFELAGGNQVRAADTLGLSRNTYRTHLAGLGAIVPRRRRGAAARSSSVVLRIGCQHYGSSHLLRARGTTEERLARHGFSVRWVDYAAGPQLLEGLGRGEIDFGSTGEMPPLLAQAAGIPFVYVGCEAPAPGMEGLVVGADSGYRDVGELAGRRIALNRGSNVHYLLIEALSARGIDLDAVDLLHLTPAEARQRLAAGEIDAWAIWDPLLTAALQGGGLRLLLDGRDLVPNRQFHVAAADFGRRHPAALEALLGELRSAGEFAATRGAEAARLVAGTSGITVPALEAAFARQAFGAARLTDRIIGQQQAIANRLRDTAVLSKAIRVSEAVWSA